MAPLETKTSAGKKRVVLARLERGATEGKAKKQMEVGEEELGGSRRPVRLIILL